MNFKRDGFTQIYPRIYLVPKLVLDKITTVTSIYRLLNDKVSYENFRKLPSSPDTLCKIFFLLKELIRGKSNAERDVP